MLAEPPLQYELGDWTDRRTECRETNDGSEMGLYGCLEGRHQGFCVDEIGAAKDVYDQPKRRW